MGNGAMSTFPLDNSNHRVQGTPMAPLYVSYVEAITPTAPLYVPYVEAKLLGEAEYAYGMLVRFGGVRC